MSLRAVTIGVVALFLLTCRDGKGFVLHGEAADTTGRRAERKLQAWSYAEYEMNVCTAAEDGAIASWSKNEYDIDTCGGSPIADIRMESLPTPLYPEFTDCSTADDGGTFTIGCNADSKFTKSVYQSADCTGDTGVPVIEDILSACKEKAVRRCWNTCDPLPSDCAALDAALADGCAKTCKDDDMVDMRDEMAALAACPAFKILPTWPTCIDACSSTPSNCSVLSDMIDGFGCASTCDAPAKSMIRKRLDVDHTDEMKVLANCAGVCVRWELARCTAMEDGSVDSWSVEKFSDDTNCTGNSTETISQPLDSPQIAEALACKKITHSWSHRMVCDASSGKFAKRIYGSDNCGVEPRDAQVLEEDKYGLGMNDCKCDIDYDTPSPPAPSLAPTAVAVAVESTASVAVNSGPSVSFLLRAVFAVASAAFLFHL